MTSFHSLLDDSGLLTRLRTFPKTLQTPVLLALALYGNDAVRSSISNMVPLHLLTTYKHLGGLLQAGFDELSVQEGLA